MHENIDIFHKIYLLIIGICLTCMDTYKKQCEGKYPPPTISSPAHVCGTANVSKTTGTIT